MGLGPVFLGPYFCMLFQRISVGLGDFFQIMIGNFFWKFAPGFIFCMSLHLQIPDIGYTLLRQLCVKLCFVLELKRLVKG